MAATVWQRCVSCVHWDPHPITNTPKHFTDTRRHTQTRRRNVRKWAKVIQATLNHEPCASFSAWRSCVHVCVQSAAQNIQHKLLSATTRQRDAPSDGKQKIRCRIEEPGQLRAFWLHQYCWYMYLKNVRTSLPFRQTPFRCLGYRLELTTNQIPYVLLICFVQIHRSIESYQYNILLKYSLHFTRPGFDFL